MNIQHWEQYLTPLGKTQLNVYPAFFVNLLKWNRIILPIFQRKYCWTLQQFKRYWYDLLYIALNIGDSGHRRHARSHDNSHTLGKIVTFEQKQNHRITIIDGQQRLTTTLIILISIKSALLKMKNKSKKDSKSTIINQIDRILFRKSIPDNINYKQGDALHFVRFLPTFFDRSFFYDVIFDKMSVCDNDRNRIYCAKRFFDKELLRFNNYEKIYRIYKKLLTKFKFVYVGIPQIEKSNVQHCIYQWFFEREMYVEQGGGDRPGYTQTVCDLFRNYVLSFFINEPIKEQKKIYKLWLRVENSYDDILELNKYIISLIDTKKQKNYDIYRDLVGFIELRLKKYKEDEYKLFMKEFIRNLKCKTINIKCNDMVVYGYIRCVENIDVDSYTMWNEIVYIIHKYMVKNVKVKSLSHMETKINKKLNLVKY